MKTLTINSLSWAKAFFMQAITPTKARPSIYKGRTAVKDDPNSKQENNSPAKKEPTVHIADIMRTAHRGNFSSGPTFLFHPGWFK